MENLKPDHETETHKWWHESIFDSTIRRLGLQKVRVYLVQHKKDGSKDYVVVGKKGVIFSDKQFEGIGLKLHILKKMRSK